MTQQAYTVNPYTGEVIEEEDNQEQRGLTVIDPSQPDNHLPSLTNMPLHFRALQLEKYSQEEQAERVLMATEYLGAAHDLLEYMNLDIEVKGAALVWHPPFRAKGTPEDGPLSPGYFNARLMLTDGTLLKSSSVNVQQALAGLLPALGWYDWQFPVVFHVSSKDGAHFISRVKRPVKREEGQ